MLRFLLCKYDNFNDYADNDESMIILMMIMMKMSVGSTSVLRFLLGEHDVV